MRCGRGTMEEESGDNSLVPPETECLEFVGENERFWLFQAKPGRGRNRDVIVRCRKSDRCFDYNELLNALFSITPRQCLVCRVDMPRGHKKKLIAWKKHDPSAGVARMCVILSAVGVKNSKRESTVGSTNG
eukprot:jgi/Mesvir1/19822/Mv13112-RA.1